MDSFKKAAKTTLLFLLVVAILSIVMAELYYSADNIYYQDDNYRTNEAGKIDTVFIGASHGLTGFVPSIVDKELGCYSYNLSGSLITMKGRYAILQEEMKRNPIKTVVIELSDNSFTRDRKTEGPAADIMLQARLYKVTDRIRFGISAFSFKEWGQVYVELFNHGMNNLMGIIKGKNEKFLDNKKGYWDNTVLFKEYNPMYKNEVIENQISEISYPENEVYLKKIIDYCKDNEARVILVTTPRREDYVYQTKNLDVPRAWYKKVAEENDVEYYDMNLLKNSTIQLDAMTDYRDDAHFTPQGAEKMTLMYCEMIKEIGGGEKKDIFFESYDKMRE